MRDSHRLGRITCGNEPAAPGADPAAGPGSRKPGTLSREGAYTGGVTASAAAPTTQTGRSSAGDGDPLVGRQFAALATVANAVTVGGDESGTASCWVWHGAAEGAPRPGGECGSIPRPAPISAVTGRSEAPCGRSSQGGLAGAFGLRPLSGVLALVLPLTLAACEADPVNARAVIEAWGYHAVGVTTPPALGRPCRFGEPYAVRFTARDQSDALVQGWLCSTDEAGEDSRILLDQGDA